MELKWLSFNNNPLGRTAEESNDYAVKALSAATGNSWEWAFDELKETAKGAHTLWASELLEQWLVAHGWEKVAGHHTPPSAWVNNEDVFIFSYRDCPVAVKGGCYYADTERVVRRRFKAVTLNQIDWAYKKGAK